MIKLDGLNAVIKEFLEEVSGAKEQLFERLGLLHKAYKETKANFDDSEAAENKLHSLAVEMDDVDSIIECLDDWFADISTLGYSKGIDEITNDACVEEIKQKLGKK